MKSMFLLALFHAVCIVANPCAAGTAETSPQLPAGVSCEQIRALVAEHGRAKALAWAIRNGHSWAEIKEARKCLH